jgi:hypothetical protein
MPATLQTVALSCVRFGSLQAPLWRSEEGSKVHDEGGDDGLCTGICTIGKVGGCVDELVRWAHGSSVRRGWDGGSFGGWNGSGQAYGRVGWRCC